MAEEERGRGDEERDAAARTPHSFVFYCVVIL
jgi:hypothetical protein